MQAVTHQQALADLVKQHQEVCGRLAAAATAEADMKQQMQRLDADRQNLQQQVEKVRDPPPPPGATAGLLGYGADRCARHVGQCCSRDYAGGL